MVSRCFLWAAPSSLRGAEWFYSGFGSAVVYTAIDVLKIYAGVEVNFSSTLLQILVSFILAVVIVFLIRFVVSPFALWMEDLRSLTTTNRAQVSFIKIKDKHIDSITMDRPNLNLRIERSNWGGESTDRVHTAIFCVVSIYNIGKTPTIAEGFSMMGITKGGEIEGVITHVPGEISFESKVDSSGQISKEIYECGDAIYSKCSNPIYQGSLFRGVIMGLFPIAEKDNFRGVKISCKDIYGRQYSVEYYFKKNERNPYALPQFFPSISVKRPN